MAPFALFVIVLIAVILLSRWINILQEYERAVTFFLGRVSQQARGPGLVFIFWPMERMVRVSTRCWVILFSALAAAKIEVLCRERP